MELIIALVFIVACAVWLLYLGYQKALSDQSDKLHAAWSEIEAERRSVQRQRQIDQNSLQAQRNILGDAIQRCSTRASTSYPQVIDGDVIDRRDDPRWPRS